MDCERLPQWYHLDGCCACTNTDGFGRWLWEVECSYGSPRLLDWSVRWALKYIRTDRATVNPADTGSLSFRELRQRGNQRVVCSFFRSHTVDRLPGKHLANNGRNRWCYRQSERSAYRESFRIRVLEPRRMVQGPLVKGEYRRRRTSSLSWWSWRVGHIIVAIDIVLSISAWTVSSYWPNDGARHGVVIQGIIPR